MPDGDRSLPLSGANALPGDLERERDALDLLRAARRVEKLLDAVLEVPAA